MCIYQQFYYLFCYWKKNKNKKIKNKKVFLYKTGPMAIKSVHLDSNVNTFKSHSNAAALKVNMNTFKMDQK